MSGGIDEQDIAALNPVRDGCGVGTSISSAPVIDVSMDMVEMDGKAAAKRVKWSGSRRVIACARCGERTIIPNDIYGSSCSCGGVFNDLMVPVLDHSKQLVTVERPSRVLQAVLEHVGSFTFWEGSL